MKREKYINFITDSLAGLKCQVEFRNSINLYDIDIIAEDFYKDLLNLVYGYNLFNLNTIDKNAIAIDLADKEAKISIQITADNSRNKINKTIEKFIEKKLYKDYERLIILILTQKKSYRNEFNTEGHFYFNKDKDILDYKNILVKIKEGDIAYLKKIADFLEEELIKKVDIAMRNQANEVVTIIDLIEYVSKNKNINSEEKKTRVDPEHKINKRFKDYAKALIKIYQNLVSLYESSVHEANIRLCFDDAKELSIGIYLMDISDNYLQKANGNAKEALENLVDFFSVELGKSGKRYDKMAIKYYLVKQIIICNVFPNIEGEWYGIV